MKFYTDDEDSSFDYELNRTQDVHLNVTCKPRIRQGKYPRQDQHVVLVLKATEKDKFTKNDVTVGLLYFFNEDLLPVIRKMLHQSIVAHRIIHKHSDAKDTYVIYQSLHSSIYENFLWSGEIKRISIDQSEHVHSRPIAIHPVPERVLDICSSCEIEHRFPCEAAGSISELVKDRGSLKVLDNCLIAEIIKSGPNIELFNPSQLIRHGVWVSFDPAQFRFDMDFVGGTSKGEIDILNRYVDEGVLDFNNFIDRMPMREKVSREMSLSTSDLPTPINDRSFDQSNQYQTVPITELYFEAKRVRARLAKNELIRDEYRISREKFKIFSEDNCSRCLFKNAEKYTYGRTGKSRNEPCLKVNKYYVKNSLEFKDCSVTEEELLKRYCVGEREKIWMAAFLFSGERIDIGRSQFVIFGPKIDDVNQLILKSTTNLSGYKYHQPWDEQIRDKYSSLPKNEKEWKDKLTLKAGMFQKFNELELSSLYYALSRLSVVCNPMNEVVFYANGTPQNNTCYSISLDFAGVITVGSDTKATSLGGIGYKGDPIRKHQRPRFKTSYGDSIRNHTRNKEAYLGYFNDLLQNLPNNFSPKINQGKESVPLDNDYVIKKYQKNSSLEKETKESRKRDSKKALRDSQVKLPIL